MADTQADLDTARDAGIAAARAGQDSTTCPYPPDRALERHLWLRWHDHEKLTLAGWPTT